MRISDWSSDVFSSDLKYKFTAKKLIFATGLNDLMPAIKGFAACLGISIIHCPYCHGFEYRHQHTGIIANGAKAFHLAPLVNNLTKKVTILTNGKADFDLEQMERLNKHHIKIIETNISERSEEHTSELQSLMRTSYAVFCLTKKLTISRVHIDRHI